VIHDNSPEINWETREVKITGCPLLCGKKVKIKKASKKRKARIEDQKDLSWTMKDRIKEKEAVKDRRKVKDMVLKWFYKWLKVLQKQESERMLVQKP